MQLELISLKRLDRIFRYSSIIGVFLLSFSLMSFSNGRISIMQTEDSTVIKDKGFRSLFSNGAVDATQPLLGQLNPLAVPYVEEYIRKNKKDLTKIREWGQVYFKLYDDILTKYGVPKELKYLSMIESELKAGATSRVGAAGPWQFMASLARDYGLKVGKRVDERRDYVKSTHAAARHLRDLYNELGDWLLVIAAYNGGINRVKNLVKRTGKDDFWKIQNMLPAETRNHVKKFIGTHFLFEGGGSIATLTGAEIDDYKEALAQNAVIKEELNFPNTEVIEITGRYNAGVIIKNLGMDAAEFNKMNPGLEKALGAGTNYGMRLPADKVAQFNEKRSQILQESVQLLLASSIF